MINEELIMPHAATLLAGGGVGDKGLRWVRMGKEEEERERERERERDRVKKCDDLPWCVISYIVEHTTL